MTLKSFKQALLISGFQVRVLNREFVPDLSDPSSEYYKSFTKDLRAAVDSTLAFKWKDVRMGKLLSYRLERNWLVVRKSESERIKKGTQSEWTDQLRVVKSEVVNFLKEYFCIHTETFSVLNWSYQKKKLKHKVQSF